MDVLRLLLTARIVLILLNVRSICRTISAKLYVIRNIIWISMKLMHMQMSWSTCYQIQNNICTRFLENNCNAYSFNWQNIIWILFSNIYRNSKKFTVCIKFKQYQRFFKRENTHMCIKREVSCKTCHAMFRRL